MDRVMKEETTIEILTNRLVQEFSDRSLFDIGEYDQGIQREIRDEIAMVMYDAVKMGIGKARNCYSPDFSAKDWDDAMKDLLKKNY